MKSMKITSEKLKKVGSGAFKNAGKKSYKKFKVSVPKKKKASYITSESNYCSYTILLSALI